ncbi:MAG: hypothetical protein OEO79_15700 [Gemmatimonadota bacterium]|nr:hypothetical protein [Gemmatimonadota bacterium]
MALRSGVRSEDAVVAATMEVWGPDEGTNAKHWSALTSSPSL